MAFKTKIKKVQSRIRRFNKHNQMTWFNFRDNFHRQVVPLEQIRDGDCLTGACIAGHVALQFAPDGTRYDREWSRLHFPDGSQEDIDDYAERQLGLTRAQAESIFMCFDNQAALARLQHVLEHPDADYWELQAIEH